MALTVKKGDTVVVIAGKDKGKTGKVLVAMPADNSVVVAGVNIISKHKKPRSAQDKGGIIKKENKIDASNVQIVCPSCGKATRVAHSMADGKKTRTCKKCGASLDATKKATKETKTTKTATKKVEETKSAPKAVEAKKETAKKAPVAEKKTETKAKTTNKTTATKTEEKKTTTKKSTTTKKVESK